MRLLARTSWPAVLLSATMLLSPAPAWSQGYPARPIRLVVPFPAGGPSDFFSRILGHRLSAELGQQVVQENRTGADGVTGVNSVAKSPPDGYTVGLTSGSVLSAIPFMTARRQGILGFELLLQLSRPQGLDRRLAELGLDLGRQGYVRQHGEKTTCELQY